MVSSDYKGKNIEDEIQKASDKLSTSPLQSNWGGAPSKALIAHGELLILTSEKIALSIDKLHESSKRLEKLTEELSKSSKGLEHLTKIVISLTVLLLICTLALLIIPPETDQSVKYLGVFMILLLAIYMFSPNKIH